MIVRQENREVPVNLFKVCMGPGCKAWDSKTILEYLEDRGEEAQGEKLIRVSPVSCLKKCGGGASVKLACGREILKLKNPEEMAAYVESERRVAVHS